MEIDSYHRSPSICQLPRKLHLKHLSMPTLRRQRLYPPQLLYCSCSELLSIISVANV